jgi:hypothetical protein
MNRFLTVSFKKGWFFMLGKWSSHQEYQNFVVSKLSDLARVNPSALIEYESEISKVFILNLDLLKLIISHLYSATGRPSNLQPEIFRSLILMNSLGYTLDKWRIKLKNNSVLRVAIGGVIPSLGSHYDFMNRIYKLNEKSRHMPKKSKPKEKIGKGNKLPNRHGGIVGRLVERILNGRRFDCRPELMLHKIFAEVCVKSSVELGLIGKKVSISGDGTCVESGASCFGVKTCECKDFNCTCNRKFSDPNASWGWDSHNNHWFYGYPGYFISTYNNEHKTDLPLYLRLVDAKRHDSVSAVVSLAEVRELYPNLTFYTFISDSASDNYPTYELLNKWNINAVIALNTKTKGNFKNLPPIGVNENGVPICPGGNLMIHAGFYDKDRCRIKWRCPRVLGKCSACEACQNCSKSSYGRTVYTHPNWDLRQFTTIPRGTIQWKNKMKERTAAERVNNRILNDYGIENSKARGKKHISFLTMIAGFNIHLDAQLKVLKSKNMFDFKSIFGIHSVA